MNQFNLLCHLTLINMSWSIPTGTLSSWFGKLLCLYPVYVHGSKCWHPIPASLGQGTAMSTQWQCLRSCSKPPQGPDGQTHKQQTQNASQNYWEKWFDHLPILWGLKRRIYIIKLLFLILPWTGRPSEMTLLSSLHHLIKICFIANLVYGNKLFIWQAVAISVWSVHFSV